MCRGHAARLLPAIPGSGRTKSFGGNGVDQRQIGTIIAVVFGAAIGYLVLRSIYEILKDFVLWLTKPIRKLFQPGSDAAIAKYGKPDVQIDHVDCGCGISTPPRT